MTHRAFTVTGTMKGPLSPACDARLGAKGASTLFWPLSRMCLPSSTRDGAVDRWLRGLRRDHDLYLEVRCRARGQATVYTAGAGGLRPVSRQGAVQLLSPR